MTKFESFPQQFRRLLARLATLSSHVLLLKRSRHCGKTLSSFVSSVDSLYCRKTFATLQATTCGILVTGGTSRVSLCVMQMPV